MHHALRFVGIPIALIVLFAALLWTFAALAPQTPSVYGVTFSPRYARELGVDPDAAYAAVLSELGVKHIRIPVYWDETETVQGVEDFSRLDAQILEAAAHGADVTLAIGYRVPRWPECFPPDWTSSLSSDDFSAALLTHVEAAVTHFRAFDNVVRWQVENEPAFYYGNCSRPDVNRLFAEIARVRALDARPVMITVSGEQELWSSFAGEADIIGTSVYRSVWDGALGTVVFPYAPSWYRVQAGLVRLFGKEVVISELQAEPWRAGAPDDATLADFSSAFSADRLREFVAFAQATGIREANVWGVEWWYYLHMNGDDGLWNVGRSLFDGGL